MPELVLAHSVPRRQLAGMEARKTRNNKARKGKKVPKDKKSKVILHFNNYSNDNSGEVAGGDPEQDKE